MAIVVMVSCALAGTTLAQVVNGDFEETPDFTGWTTSGSSGTNTDIEGLLPRESIFGSPIQKANMGYAHTLDIGEGGLDDEAVDGSGDSRAATTVTTAPMTMTELAAFLSTPFTAITTTFLSTPSSWSVSPSSTLSFLGTTAMASGFKQTISHVEGKATSIPYEYRFYSDSPGSLSTASFNKSFAFVWVTPATDPMATIMEGGDSFYEVGSALWTTSDTDWGYQKFGTGGGDITITAGVHTADFLVAWIIVEADDGFTLEDVGLFIDNIPTIPEPSSLVLIGVAAGMGLAARRRRKREGTAEDPQGDQEDGPAV